MPTNGGLLSAADIQTELDAYGSLLKGQFANLGLGAPAETTTLAALALAARKKILGDGTTSFPGLANPDRKSELTAPLLRLCQDLRWDALLQIEMRGVFDRFDARLVSRLPSGWSLNDNTLRPLAAWVSRLNGLYPTTPAAPDITAATLGYTTGGALPLGGVPKIKLAYVGALSGGTSGVDWIESQPSGSRTFAALTGANNAVTLSGLGNAPTSPFNVYKVRVYRTISDGTGSFFFDQDVAVTPGAAIGTIASTKSDEELRQDVAPVTVWDGSVGGCPILPEEAALYAVVNGLANQTGDPFGLAAPAPNGFFHPSSVALGPVPYPATFTAVPLLGYNNPASTGILGVASATTFAEVLIVTANDTTKFTQGFKGAFNSVRARVTVALATAAATITNISYKYVTAASPTTELTQTAYTPGGGLNVLSQAIHSVLDLAIPAGRIVTRITAMTITGPTGSSEFILEGVAARSI